jgi:hypothetical protein
MQLVLELNSEEQINLFKLLAQQLGVSFVEIEEDDDEYLLQLYEKHKNEQTHSYEEVLNELKSKKRKNKYIPV